MKRVITALTVCGSVDADVTSVLNSNGRRSTNGVGEQVEGENVDQAEMEAHIVKTGRIMANANFKMLRDSNIDKPKQLEFSLACLRAQSMHILAMSAFTMVETAKESGIIFDGQDLLTGTFAAIREELIFIEEMLKAGKVEIVDVKEKTKLTTVPTGKDIA